MRYLWPYGLSRYISTATAAAEIDLPANYEKLLAIEQDIQTATAEHNKFLKELDLPLLPYSDSKSSRD